MGFSFFQQLQKRNRDFEIDLGGKKVPVKVVENDRAKRLILRIAPSGDALKVTVPGHIGDEEIEEFVARNRAWAVTRISRLPARTKIEPGAYIPYRGVDHEIVASGKLRGLVSVGLTEHGPGLIVPGSEDRVSAKLVAWLKKEARRELNEAVIRHADKIGVRPKQIRITDTTSRWGSCSSTRTLSFSWRIIMAPPEVLEYLAAHEVAHLVEMNHSERFWNLTRELWPDTCRDKQWLRQNGTKLHSISV